jgi:hypothetical protein
MNAALSRNRGRIEPLRSDSCRGGTTIAAIVLVGSLIGAPVSADDGGIYVTSPMSVEGSRESKFIVNNQALDDNVLLVLPPTVSVLSVSARGEIALSYQPELELFATHTDLDSLNHSAELLFSHSPNRDLTVSAGDSFISTSDPSRRVVDSVLLLPRDRLTQNSASLQLARRFGRATAFSLSLNNVVTVLANPLTSATQLTNSVASAANVSLSQTIARKHLLSVTYSFLDARPLQAQVPVQPEDALLVSLKPQEAHGLALSYMYQGDGLSLRAAAGVVAGIGDGVLVPGRAYTGSARVDKSVGRSATLSVIGQRSLSYFSSFGGAVGQPDVAINSSGLVPAAIYESLILRLSGDLSRYVSARVEGSVQRTYSNQDVQGPVALDVRSQFARLRLDYWVNRNFAFFGTAEFYRQSFNEFVGLPLNWQRYGVGLEVAATSRPNPLARRQKEESLRERRYRMGAPPDAEVDVVPGEGVSQEPGPEGPLPGRDK